MNTNFEKYLTRLIGFPSVTPSGKEALEYISLLLASGGFTTEIKTFGDKEYQVTNLYAKYGNSKPNICFAGHIDVVPPGDLSLWDNHPFVAMSTRGKIYGRGAVDMKGAIACMLCSTLDYLQANPRPRGSISFLITSDEEGTAKYGTQEMLKYLASIGESLDFAILGEPTSEKFVGDTIKIGRRGSINFNLEVKGMQGHVAYPTQADNPINPLVKIMNELIDLPLDEGTKFFQKSHLEIISLDVGNKVTNVIPGKACAKFNIRFNDTQSSERLSKLVDQIASKYAKNYELTSKVSAQCFIQEPVGLIAEFAEIVKESCSPSEVKFSGSGGTSDARFIKDYCPVVEFGLLSETAHKINEYTEISDLQRLRNVYYSCLSKFLG